LRSRRRRAGVVLVCGRRFGFPAADVVSRHPVEEEREKGDKDGPHDPHLKRLLVAESDGKDQKDEKRGEGKEPCADEEHERGTLRRSKLPEDPALDDRRLEGERRRPAREVRATVDATARERRVL